MPVFATAGAKFYVGGALSDQYEDFELTDFDGQTWTRIGELESLGSLGDTAESMTWMPMGAERTKRIKGMRTAGTMEVVCGLDYSDAGQSAVIAAEKTDDNYAFKVEFDDAPAGGTPSERYFVAIVGGASEQYDQANNVMRLNVTLWPNSNVVRVDAAEAP